MIQIFNEEINHLQLSVDILKPFNTDGAVAGKSLSFKSVASQVAVLSQYEDVEIDVYVCDKM